MKYFGTDGIRMPAEKFTQEFLTKIVHGLVEYAGSEIKVFLAGDTRESSEWILADLETALESFGVEYSPAGVLPTPAISHCFYEMGFDFAIDVTASHNPYTDNGIKIFERGPNSGEKLSEKGREIIEKALSAEQNYDLVSPTIREDLHAEAIYVYTDHLKSYLKEGTNLSPLKIGIDCANGATSVIGESIFNDLGAETELINANQNYNTIINKNCGSTHPKLLQNLVKENTLDLGVAFDGDGDRCLCVDENGELVDGDEIIAIIANYLNLDAIAVTVMANQGILNWAKENQIKTEITPVGDSNVALAMKEKNIAIGGEQSGHIILPGEASGDGILTALVIAKIISETNRPLSDLKKIIKKSPQVIVNVPASDEQKTALKTSEKVKNLLLEYDKLSKELDGRILVRPSGTEPLIRITMWGNDEQKITALAEELKEKLCAIIAL